MNLGYKRRSYSYEDYQGYQGFKVFFIVVSCTWVYLGLELFGFYGYNGYLAHKGDLRHSGC